jgi:hypothetical protein
VCVRACVCAVALSQLAGDKKLNRELVKAESVSTLSDPQSMLNPMHEGIEHPHPDEVHTEIAPFHHVEEVTITLAGEGKLGLMFHKGRVPLEVRLLHNAGIELHPSIVVSQAMPHTCTVRVHCRFCKVDIFYLSYPAAAAAAATCSGDAYQPGRIGC